MYIPMELDSLYHPWLPMSLEYLSLKVGFLPLEADMDAEVMVFCCGCQGHSQACRHVKMGHNQQRSNRK